MMLYFRSRFYVLLLALVLVACGSDKDEQTDNEKAAEIVATIDKLSAQSSSNFTPHGKKDPHAGMRADQYVNVALQHLQAGRTQQALEATNDGLYYHPGSAPLHAMRGSLYFSKGNIAKALGEIETAISVEPENPAYLVNRAQALQKFKRHREAMDDLNKAIELQPDFLPALFNRGTAYFNNNQLDLALDDFNQCIAIDPHVAAPYFNRAAVYDAQGKRNEAVADIKRFIKISDNEQWQEKANELLTLWQQQDQQK